MLSYKITSTSARGFSEGNAEGHLIAARACRLPAGMARMAEESTGRILRTVQATHVTPWSLICTAVTAGGDSVRREQEERTRSIKCCKQGIWCPVSTPSILAPLRGSSSVLALVIPGLTIWLTGRQSYRRLVLGLVRGTAASALAGGS